MLILEPATPPVVSTAMAADLSMAIHTSLLMLPETFTREQLYTVIAGLSYQGKNYMHTYVLNSIVLSLCCAIILRGKSFKLKVTLCNTTFNKLYNATIHTIAEIF